MKNKYRFLAILSVLFLGFNVAFAGRVSQDEAAAIAARFTNEQPQLSRMHKAPRQASNMRLAHKALQNNSEEVAFYVFNQEGNNGYVIVSADDRTAEEVLGYNEHGSFDYSKINPNLKWWLSRYTDEITALQTMDESELEKVPVRKAKQVTAIANLLVNDQGKEITWYQEEPYNNLCPMDQRDNTRCLTGCVATAASQIMYMWRWPKKGTGSSSYEWHDCKDDNCNQYWTKTLSANYGETTYDWDNMLPAYIGKNYTEAQANAVATLMYHAGVSAEMSYGGQKTGGSGAWTDNMAYGFITYFGYKIDKFITMYSKVNYGDAHEGVPAEYSVTRAKFTEYFNADLEAGRPIIMGGDGNDGGHEFVCCGRDANNKFYINWGWEGEDNGYFALSSLKPSGYDFSSNLDAIIGLRPDKKDLPMIDITWSVDGVETTTQIMQEDPLELPADPANCESGKVFVGWTAQSSVDGEKPADLFKTAAGKTVTEAVTYYAVFATADGEGSAVDASTTFKFSEIAQAKGWENSVAYTSIEIDPVTVKAEGGGNNGKWYTSGNGSWRMYSGGTVRISVKDATLTSVTSSPECDWTISNNQATFSPSARTDFTQIVVNYTSGSGATYSDYSLTCGAAVDCELTGITLNTDNVKKAFVTGDTFTSEGLVVTANYSNCNDKNKTSMSVVTAPDMTVAGTKDVKVSYTEGDVTKEASYQITVTDPVTYTVTWSVEGEETKVVYVEGKPLALPEQTPEDCSDSRVFVGWTASNAVSDKPADLFTTASGNVNADVTYYAVFATVTSGSENAAWQRVSDANSLQAGDVLVIACDSKGATAGDIDNAVMASVTTSISDGTITAMGEGTVELTLGGQKDAWTLTSSNGALGATAAKKLAWGSGTTTWKISIASGDATIQNTTNDYGRFLYNVNSPRFTTYTSNTSASMLLPQLYRRSGGVSYEDYSLICDDEPTDVEAVQTKSAVQKQLVGDQLMIIRDGQKFTVTGVRLQ
ncbi:MAG: C10 family peptidase [Paludibacteraceae bacterium]|nr:C10 family peptidase [Paludibacteraceae bacterium]